MRIGEARGAPFPPPEAPGAPPPVAGASRASSPTPASSGAAFSSSSATSASSSSREEGPSPFAQVLARLGREVDRGERVVRRAIEGAGGRDLGPGELLALQAGVYRYSEAVDLTAKLVDRASGGVKTVLQGQ